jgi:hypothetical protein
MNIEDFKKLSVQDALQAAGKYAGVDASVFDGIWNAESARGKAMLSPAGARGHFGLMPKTQALFEKKLGIKVNPDDFHDSLFVAMNHLADDLKREGGNVVSALRAYNNGPQWRAQKDPRGENKDYARRVLGANGVTEEAGTAQTVKSVPPTFGPLTLDSSSGELPVKGLPSLVSSKTMEAVASAGFLGSISIDPQKVDPSTVFQANAAASVAKQKEIDDSSLIDKAQSAFITQGVISRILKYAARPEYEPVAGYVVPEELLSGRSADDQSYLLEARSPQEAERLAWELDNDQEENRRLSLGGGWQAFGASIIAGAPEAMLTGIGISKALATAGMGSAAAAQAGNAGRAIGLNVLENVGGNLAMTAIEDAMGGRMSVFDYAAGAVGGLLFSGPAAIGLRREAGAAAQQLLARKIVDEAAARQAEVAGQALKNLGDDATAAELAKEIDRLEAAAVRKEYGTNTAGDDRQLLPDMEKLEADEVLAEADNAKAKPDVPTQTLTGAPNREDLLKLKDSDGNPVVQRQTTGLDLLTTIATSNGDNYVKQLASRLMTAIGTNPVSVYIIDEKNMSLVSGGRADRAHYAPGKHAVFLTEDEAVNPRHRWIVTHEMAHAASSFKLEAAVNLPNTEVGRIAKEIGALRKELGQVWERSGKKDKSIEYFLSNDYEFLAGLYSGRNTFTDFLKATKVADNKTAWNGFVDLMRRLLGIPDNEMEAFTKALNLSEQLLSTPLNTKVRYRDGTGMNVAQAPMTIPQQEVAQRYGLDLMPQGTPLQRAEHKAMVALYTKADRPDAPWNNIDPKWVDSLTAKSDSIGSTGLLMLRSKNPVVRMVASELLESTTGAGGRRTTASITKYMNERKYLGNTINEFQDAYKLWRNAQGGSIWEDYSGGKYWADFNKKVAMEMEARRQGVTVESAPAVRKAADVVEQAYERMRIDQIDKKTVGWANLPASSRGYMPHRISSETVRNMTQAQHRAWHASLVDQFVNNEGWDISFSANLAAKYIDRAKVRAMGGHEIPANVHHTGAADVVQDALTAMGMSRDEVRAQMAKFMRGGAGHTKARLKLDLLQEFEDGGTKFTLMDLFETDQLTLLRNQAQRVSGETALAKHGIMGKSGMDLIRRAMADFGEDAGKTQPGEIQAFDQVAAEFLGQPFGDYGGKWMNRAMQANSLARLGGMVFTQFGEYINLATTLGVGKAFSAIGGLPRLRAEAAKLARGEKVDNPILSSIETYGGAEFGTDAYKMVFPFDNPSLQYQVNGHDTVYLADRLLRGGMHAQGKLSLWRAVHGAQQRGVAEQIVHKAMKMVRDGTDSKVLADMGIDAQLAADLRMELPNIARFDGAGRLQELDITKAENRKAAEAFVQAVHRGTGQIIQGTFIGETGKWAHSGWLRLLTQFRTFSITSVEKQWGRNRNNHGVAVALGILVGAMSMAAPIYMARQVVNSIGRPDQEEWLDKQLSFEKVARATLNYVAMSGLAGDFLDAFASVTGLTESTGGRAGSTTEFVGTVIAPAAGLADDLWRGIQNSKDGTDVHELVKNLPFAKLPMLVPVINLLDE